MKTSGTRIKMIVAEKINQPSRKQVYEQYYPKY